MKNQHTTTIDQSLYVTPWSSLMLPACFLQVPFPTLVNKFFIRFFLFSNDAIIMRSRDLWNINFIICISKLDLPVITGMGPTHRIRELQPYQSLKLS